LGLLALAACGGGGGGGTTTGGGGGGGGGGNPDSFLDPGATQSFSLTTFSSEGGAASTNNDTAQGATISLGGLTGRFNSARDRIDFDGDQGTADILSVSTEQVALFNAKPRDAEPFLGVIGVPTLAANLPEGANVIYTGNASARFAIIDGNTGATFDVTGDVLAVVDFDGQSLGLTFDDFRGTSVTGANAPVAVSGIGTLEIEAASIVGNQFSGGTADFVRGGSFSTDLSLNAVATTSGGVFGENGGEIAGVVIVEDSTADLRFIGGFVAD
jgi:hypothetical protein